MKTLAAILVKQNQPLAIDEITIPDELLPGQVLVKVVKTGICGAQLREINGDKGPDKFLPHLLGHEAGGIVERIGPGVKKVRPGDHVVCHWRKGGGIEADPPKYVWKDTIVGAGPIATWSEHSVISENRLTPIPTDFPLEYAALMGCAITTGFGIVANEAQLKIGQKIIVCGVGGVGLLTVLAAKLAGAGQVIAVDQDKNRATMSLQYGACCSFSPIEFIAENFYKSFLQTDVFVDFTGDPNLIVQGIKYTKTGGKIILAGQPKHGTDLLLENFGSLLYQGKTIMDSQGGTSNPDTDIPRLVEFFRNNKENYKHLSCLTGNHIPLKEINTRIGYIFEKPFLVPPRTVVSC